LQIDGENIMSFVKHLEILKMKKSLKNDKIQLRGV